jgi:hypothetical protein
MLEMSREELLERLKRLDEDAYLSFETEDRFHLVIVGGGALILQQYIAKASALNERRYLDFKYNYDEYVGRYQSCVN